ncbi:tyrosine-type recombinase/integrase [Streptomyces sp. H27-S2]|uniref:tyrosine-type recombinase/integrase n=1 Tax=Streptomyces antarcticus TaxID=2996458 RepID=UPI002270D335|nr:tyrosine-type recombinase/integrase [Streptomyces sp. H27-S2]MCY0949032.1 tyrosine-type recombinase/integrase [Streptomyces sp. H27-S2]
MKARSSVAGAALDGQKSAITPKGLRDTAASLAVASGANVKDVQRMLGHKSAALTLDVYAVLWPEGLHTVASKLDAARAVALAA